MILAMDYRAHDAFVAPARQTAEVWRLSFGIVLLSAFVLFLNVSYGQLIATLLYPTWPSLFDDLDDGSTPAAMFLMLFSFAFMAIAAGAVALVLHKRAPTTLLGPMRPFIGQLAAVTLISTVVMAAVWALPPYDMGAPLTPNLALGTWVMLLPLSLLAVLVQVSGEEIIFRGYLQQQLGARFRSPLVWMVLPSALFGSLHYMPETAGENALIIVAWATLFGMLMADLTARSGTLGPAIAVHFVNNVSAILIVSVPDDLFGLALYIAPFGLSDTDALRAWLPADFALMIVLWLAARLALRR